jgi:hypothetical protein
MNATELRARYQQAIVTEEDWGRNLADHKRELAACDEDFQPLKVAMLRGLIVEAEAELRKAGDLVDQLRREIRAANLPPAPPPPSGDAVADMLSRDRVPKQWGTGGHISERDREWQ